jgi:hypothetical protein
MVSERKRLIFYGASSENVKFEACDVLNNNKFTLVNVCFQHKHNEEIGIFWQVLSNRFAKILKNTDIILNPIYIPMRSQGKIQKRREFLSANMKYYFSSCNTKKGSTNLNLKSLQYAFSIVKHW